MRPPSHGQPNATSNITVDETSAAGGPASDRRAGSGRPGPSYRVRRRPVRGRVVRVGVRPANVARRPCPATSSGTARAACAASRSPTSAPTQLTARAPCKGRQQQPGTLYLGQAPYQPGRLQLLSSRRSAVRPGPAHHRANAHFAATCFIASGSVPGQARSRRLGRRSLSAAAHAGRVALSWPARSGRRPRAGRGSRGVCSARSSGALPARRPGDGSSIGGRAWTQLSLAWTRTNALPRSR